MAFYVGQKVVCVDDTPGIYSGRKLLVRGATYTVLSEPYESKIGNLIMQVDVGNGWALRRFRPLTSRPTSISIFTAMLGPKQKETIDG